MKLCNSCYFLTPKSLSRRHISLFKLWYYVEYIQCKNSCAPTVDSLSGDEISFVFHIRYDLLWWVFLWDSISLLDRDDVIRDIVDYHVNSIMPLQHEHGEWTNENKTDENKNEQETEILATNSKKSKEYFKIEFYKGDNHWMVIKTKRPRIKQQISNSW